MGKVLKIVFGVIGVVLLLVVLAVGAFALFFDPNDFRSQITAAAKKSTGRDLALGDIKLGFYPVLGANVKNVSLSNAAGFGDAPMLVVAEADVGVRLLPLLMSREIRIGKISLTGMKLNLAKDATGKSNWDDLSKTDETAAKPEEEKSGGGAGIKSIDISGIAIKGADIRYDDKQSGQAYAVSGLELETGSISPGDPFDIKLAFSTTVKQPAAKADIKLSTRVEYDLKAKTYSADKLALKVLATMPDQKADIDLSGNLSADMNKQTAKADKLSLKVKATTKDGTADIDVAGNASADLGKKTALTDKLTVKLKAALKDLNANADLAVQVSAEYDKPLVRAQGLTVKVDADGAAVPGGKQTATFAGDAIYDGEKGTLKLASGDLKAAGLDATIALDAIGLNTDAPRFVGPLSVKTFNPRELMKLLDIKVDTADPETLKALTLRLKFDATTKAARISDLNMKLDQSTFTGSGAVTSFDSKAAEFALKLDTIDADRYLPTPAVPVKEAPRTPEEKSESQCRRTCPSMRSTASPPTAPSTSAS